MTESRSSGALVSLTCRRRRLNGTRSIPLVRGPSEAGNSVEWDTYSASSDASRHR